MQATVREILNDARERIKETTGANVVNIKYSLVYRDGILPNSELGRLREIITEVTGVQWSLILKKTRIHEVSEARQLFSYFATDFFGLGLMSVARIIKRDHTTVLFGRDKIRDLIYVKDTQIIPKVNLIKSCLNEIQTQPN